jgi:hypothetical protein
VQSDRRGAAVFALCGLLCCTVGTAVCVAAYGTDFLAHIGMARDWRLGGVVATLTGWLSREPVAILLAALLFRRARSDNWVRLAALYAAVAIGLGGFFGGAKGVVENAMFDADIAMGLSAALVLERPPSLLLGRWRDGDAIVALYGLSTLLGVAFNAPTVWRHLTQT